MNMQVNVTTQVNSKTIRREQHNGREHWVIPSYTLPANVVMNGGLYPASEIDAHYPKLEGTLAPLGHPTVNGQHVSAFSPEGINVGHVGAWNRNVKKAGNRVYVEKWLDVEVANRSESGRRLVERLEALERGDDVPPIHTSVAVFLDRIEANEEQRKGGYEWVAKIHGMDHDAILLDEVGAATPEQGVGLMVNADQAHALQANAGALVGESYREKETRLERAAKAKFRPSENEYVWVVDFTDSQVVVQRSGQDAERYGYKVENGEIVFEDQGRKVERQQFWAPIVNALKSFLNPQANQPATTPKEGTMPLTPEERAELTADISKALAANMAEQLKPLTETIAKLQANAEAAAKAADDALRAELAAVTGELAANALSGEALREAHSKLVKPAGTPAALAGNSAQTVPAAGAPDLATYPGV